MTYDKAVELLKTQFYPDHHKPYVKLSDDTIHQIFQALERGKALEYHRATTENLWATDRPDLIPDDIKHLFFKIKYED